jgi:hypothetical protein
MTMIAFLAAAALSLAPEARTLSWADLVPEGQEPAQAPTDTPVHETIGQQTGSAETVPELDEAYVRLPGFMLPLDYTDKGQVAAFLLVPYYGACIHVPPPPPNQIVFVTTDGEPVDSKGLWDPVWVTGTMQVKMNDNDLGDAAYTLVLDEMVPYRN